MVVYKIDRRGSKNRSLGHTPKKGVLKIDATDRSKISSDQKRFFIALSLYPLSFFANTPFKS